ncbi:MAG: TonB-dependent receptor [Parabacteroides sp.]|nr:TonB-dependent receptor [Parabacteroides sp.]
MKKTIEAVSGIKGRLWMLMLAVLCMPVAAWAQTQRTVTGTVCDETGEPLIGVSVQVVGVPVGTSTDIDGRYSLKISPEVKQLAFSYVGYLPQTLNVSSDVINVTLRPNNQLLDEVVVIGYGVRKKNDLTGSVASVSEKDFNKGMISSAEELINGKIAGVQITSAGGSPNGGSTIRVRGGASLNASNDPLIVLDGVPLEVGGSVQGSGNFLSLINPNDIESMTILKDASSTAIYGSRASNGVILIATKKGSGDRIRVSFQTTNSLSTKSKVVPTMNRNEFINAVNTFGTDAQKAILAEGIAKYDADTDWNDEIYHTAYGTDNNISVAGRAAAWLPFRVSLGGMYQDGILRTDNANRYTGNVNLNPTLFDDHLHINLSAKGTYSKSRFANTDAVWNAMAYDPTRPVYDPESAFGGYYEVIDNAGRPAQGAIANPVAMLEQTSYKSKVYRVITNADINYRLHPLPELRLHLIAGYDYSRGQTDNYVEANSFGEFSNGGSDYRVGPQKNYNKLLTAYVNYNKDFKAIRSNVDATFGYDYQHWKYTIPAYDVRNIAGETRSTSPAVDQRHNLQSYYGRLNYTLMERYLVTATFRRDGSSRFAENNRWGTFPSVALAWRVSHEDFWKSLSPVMNDFKLRASYGVTGQQDGIANYFYMPSYTISQPGAYYPVGGEPIYTYRPEAYNDNLKWETTKSWNFGIDFGFLDNRFTGTVDYYTRKTEDLLATVPVPAGTNFAREMLMNVGNVLSKGVEIAVNANLVSTKDWTWSATANAAWQRVRITNLTLNPDSPSPNTPVGWMESTPVMVFSTDYAPYSYFLYKQVYDEKTGLPVEGLYADLNGDGKVDENDRYHSHSPSPDWILGFSTSVRYKKWTLSTSLRANLGNYLYNGSGATQGAWECTTWCAGQINNLNASFLDTQFRHRQYMSDYYLENASFLRMDNLQLMYDFGKVYRTLDLHVSAMVQNVFTVTKYKGVDPEASWGIDNGVYPRPRTYSMTIGLNF